MPDTSIINIRGIELLDEKHKEIVNRLLNEYYTRIYRQLKNITVLEAQIKAYKKVAPSKGEGRRASSGREGISKSKGSEGKAPETSKIRKKGVFVKRGKDKKYSFSIKVVGSAGVFRASYADWDFTRVIHKVLNKVMNEIESKLHSSDKHDKVRRGQMKRARG